MLLLLLSSLASAAPLGWKLAGIYDATALAGGGVAAGQPLNENWLWQPAPGMQQSCGAAKAPDGLGVMEAQAIANGMTPALAVLLRRTGTDVPLLDSRTVHVSIGGGDVSGAARMERLAPLVEQAPIAVDIEGEESLLAEKLLVGTQLAMELCLEHKTGRAWGGNVKDKLREAFLLQSPDERGADRMYFRGQADPVPALARPPDACLVSPVRQDARDLKIIAGAGSLRLVPADVWGASLRGCAPGQFDSAPLAGRPPSSPGLPLSLSGVGTVLPPTELAWRRLNVRLFKGEDIDDTRIDVSLDDQVLVENEPLLRKSRDAAAEELPLQQDERASVEDRRYGLVDILAKVPKSYPTRGTATDPNAYTILLIPNWQLVEAANRVHRLEPGSKDAVSDGVGWVLAHPERLFVQVGDMGTSKLPNLTSKLSGATGAILRWGYVVGSNNGRSDIVLPSSTQPSWAQVEVAQRTRQQGLFLGSATVVALLLMAGFRRVPDLWTRVPEERINYWPGAGGGESGGTPTSPLGEAEMKE